MVSEDALLLCAVNLQTRLGHLQAVDEELRQIFAEATAARHGLATGEASSSRQAPQLPSQLCLS